MNLNRLLPSLCASLPILLFSSSPPAAAEGSTAEATLTVHAETLAPCRIPRYLTGKFCEHLGANIYNGMDAQILRNSTFADFQFGSGQMSPDGIATFQYEREKIEAELRRQAMRAGWPESDLSDLLAARATGLAAFWSRTGALAGSSASPDTGPYGGRAQRLQLEAGSGIKQWAWLPLHRTSKCQFEILARSPDMSAVDLALFARDAKVPCATARIEGVSREWKKVSGSFVVPEDASAEVPYRLELSARTAGQLIIRHLFLWPADHVNGADPDVIRLLKGSHLPLLRWPGGNFVSAYHWEDAVGPVEQRRTRPNFAWGGTAGQFQTITDHPLIGGNVPRSTDPLDVYRDFMHVPAILERKWSELRDAMARGGIREPRLAVTELQLFAHLAPLPRESDPQKLTPQNLVNPSSLAEALYDTLIYHAAVRLQPFVEMVTHSATVNHGGGLRKERERVYANPCHYAHLLFAAFAEATPLKTELTCPNDRASLVLPEIKNSAGDTAFAILDPLAALSPNGELLLSLVHRGTTGPLRLTVVLDHFAASRARLQTLAGPAPWAANTLETPDALHPNASERQFQNNTLSLELPPYSISQLIIPRQ